MIEMLLYILLQVFLKFKTPFWAKKKNNLAEPILYGKLPVEKKKNDQEDMPKMGATGRTDGRLRQVLMFFINST